MKYLILGAGGMAGHTISAYLHEQGHDVLGLVRRTVTGFQTLRGDVRDTAFLRELIFDGKFDAVINCVGILNQAAEDHKERAVFLNAYLPHYLADVVSGTNTRIVHMSTDCVFSGKRGGYKEDDLRDGTTFYDRTKALGELEDDHNITLRNSIVGPDLSPAGIGLFNWFMAQTGEIRGYTHAMWTGVTTLELAKAMEAATRDGIHGLHHIVYNNPISKYELLCLFRKQMSRQDVVIKPWEGYVADKSLLRTRFDFNYIVPDYEKMIAEMADWIRAHHAWYPHYRLGD